MGDGVVVLPKAVDEVVGERRDRGDRFRSAVTTVVTVSAASGKGSPSSITSVSCAALRGPRRCRRPAPQRSRRRRMADGSSSSIRPVSRWSVAGESSSTREAKITSLTLVYQPELSRASSPMDYRESLNPWALFRSLPGVPPGTDSRSSRMPSCVQRPLPT